MKSSQRIIAPMLNAACTGSSSYDVPGTRAPPGSVAPGTTGPISFVHAGYLQRLEAAAERVHQAVVRGFVSRFAVNAVRQRVVGDIGEDFVGCGSFGGLVIVGRHVEP